MKILFCNYEYPPLGGGGGIVMAALARQLARRHQVTVLTSRANGLPPASIEEGIRVIRVPVLFRKHMAVANFPSMLAYLPSGFVRGLLLARQHTFDIVNTHFALPSGPLGHALSRVYRVPNVLSVHGGDLFDPSKASSPHRHAPLRQSVRWLLKAADAVIGQSQDTLDRVRSIYGVQRSMSLIQLGIERPPLRPNVQRAAFGLPQHAFVLVTVGRLIPRKAVTQLVEILAATRIADAHLLIVGSGPEENAIRDCARSYGLMQRVHLLGHVSEADKHAALQVADVFVSTSQHEGFGLVFLEAMAHGLPIVCYDRGGQTDFLATGQSGHVVPLNDRRTFCEALLALHADPIARRTYAARNLERVESFFIDACAARYEQVFEHAIAIRAAKDSRSDAISPSS